MTLVYQCTACKCNYTVIHCVWKNIGHFDLGLGFERGQGQGQNRRPRPRPKASRPRLKPKPEVSRPRPRPENLASRPRPRPNNSGKASRGLSASAELFVFTGKPYHSMF